MVQIREAPQGRSDCWHSSTSASGCWPGPGSRRRSLLAAGRVQAARRLTARPDRSAACHRRHRHACGVASTVTPLPAPGPGAWPWPRPRLLVASESLSSHRLSTARPARAFAPGEVAAGRTIRVVAGPWLSDPECPPYALSLKHTQRAMLVDATRPPTLCPTHPYFPSLARTDPGPAAPACPQPQRRYWRRP